MEDVMVFQIRFQQILINDSGVFPTLEAGWSTGGCLAPKVLIREEDEKSNCSFQKDGSTESSRRESDI